MANYVSQNSLPADSLDEVFALCDVDQDGFLSLPEFTSAAHIFYLHQTVGGMTSEPRLGSSHSIDASQRSHRPARRRVRDPDERLHV